jgi:gentisate 1,2-dioxygenase
MATLGCGISKLPAGYAGAPHRHSSSNVYLVVEGTGRITVGDDVFDWGPRDCFVVPAWATHSLANASAAEAAILFTATDAPALEALGLHHQEPAPAAN